jgi:hypothetical protein
LRASPVLNPSKAIPLKTIRAAKTAQAAKRGRVKCKQNGIEGQGE